jgi:hypothetical protein
MNSFFLTFTSVFSPRSDGRLWLIGPCNQFNQRVRIRSIVLHTSDPQEGPKLIKLLVNRSAIGFDDVQDAEESQVAQVLEVSDKTIREGQPIVLRYVRFQLVDSLHVSTAAAPSHPGEHVTFVDLRRIESRRCRTDSHRFYRYTRILRRVRRPSIVSHWSPSLNRWPPASATKDLSELKKQED